MSCLEDKKKEKRRPRNDPQNRNFICGCGKSYLSYPALYTHQKTKHGNDKPPGTRTPLINGSGHRGRPKKEESENQKGEEHKDESSEYESECSDDGLDEFLYYLSCFGRNLKLEEGKQLRLNEQKNVKQEKNFSFLLDIAEDGYDILLAFPKEFFTNSEDYQSIYSQLEKFDKNKKLVEDILDVEGPLITSANIDEIFSIFLLKISKHMKPQYYKEMVLFICIYRKALMELSNKNGENDSRNLKAEFIIDKSNEFILQLLPRILQEFKIPNLIFLGPETEKINNAIFLTQHFGNWLFSVHFTDSKLEMNYGDLER